MAGFPDHQQEAQSVAIMKAHTTIDAKTGSHAVSEGATGVLARTCKAGPAAMALVIGLAALTAQASETDLVRDIQRYCTVCWRNARLDPEFALEHLPGFAVDGQRFGLPSAGVQGAHECFVQRLA